MIIEFREKDGVWSYTFEGVTTGPFDGFQQAYQAFITAHPQFARWIVKEDAQ